MILRVKHLDGSEVDVTTSASARLLWERDHGPLLNAMSGMSTEWATFLAYTTLKRSEAIEFDDILDWADTVEAVQWDMPLDALTALAVTLGVIAPADDAEEVSASDPTEPGTAPSPTSS